MTQLHLVAQIVDDLFERFDTLGDIRVGILKGFRHQTEDLLHGLRHHIQLVHGLIREMDLFLMAFLEILRDISGMVGDTLEVGQCMQIKGGSTAL